MKQSNKWDYRFLRLAKQVASWSKDPSTKTGAVIVALDRSVVSVGFNGFPIGMSDDQSLYENRESKYSRIIHCEINALIFAGKLPPECTLYTWPFLSCDRCAVQMIQAGVMRFVSPIASPDAIARWGTAFEKTRTYIRQCNKTYDEINLPRTEMEEFVDDFAQEPCEYADNCPPFGTRHGTCLNCRARRVVQWELGYNHA